MYITHPKVKAGTCDYAEQMRHRSDPMEIDETAYQAKDEYDGNWEEVQALGQGKGKAKGKGKSKSKGSNKGAGKGAQTRRH